MPPAGPLNVPGQSARPVVVALQQFLGNHDIAKLDKRPVDLGKVRGVQFALGLSVIRSKEGARVVGADQSQRAELAHTDDDPSTAYGRVPGHGNASVLAGVLGVLLGRAAGREVLFESGYQNTEVHRGLATVVVLRTLQPPRIIELAQQRQQIGFALGHALILAQQPSAEQLGAPPHSPFPDITHSSSVAVVTAVGGWAIGRGAEAGGKSVLRAAKTAAKKRNAPCSTKGQVFDVLSDGEDDKGLALRAGDQYRVMERDGEAILIEVLGGTNNLYFTSAQFLASVSGFPKAEKG